MERSSEDHFLCTVYSGFYQEHYYLDNICYQEIH